MCRNLCVFFAQLHPRGCTASEASLDGIMMRHDAMLASGVDGVFLNPECAALPLRQTIRQARSAWSLNAQRMLLMLEAEPPPVSDEDMRSLKIRHNKLLWDSIPRALMPRFPLVDRNLVETGNAIDRYSLVRMLDTVQGTVLQAVDASQKTYAIKVIDKSSTNTPGALEGIYREFRFTIEILHHPNVVRCFEMLHSSLRIYLVFDFAGPHNFAEVVGSRPGQRMEEEEALQCFSQIADGLAYCHSRDVAHRSVSLEHVVLTQLPGQDRFRCQLVDFHCSMVARGNATSHTV